MIFKKGGKEMRKEQSMLPAAAAFAIAFIMLVKPVAADELILENGDRLTGIVIGIDNGILTLKTGYSEPIKLKANLVTSITTDNPVEVHLSGGEILKGKLSPVDGRQIAVGAGPERTRTIIDWNKISAVNPPPPAKQKWEGNVTVGGSMQSGNTDSASASVSVQAARKTADDRYSFRVLYNYGEDDSVRNTDNIYGAMKYDYFLSKKVYAYLSVEALKDTFKDLNLRTSIGPGLGYQVWDEDIKTLSFEMGVSYYNEDLETGDDNSWITARMGANFRYLLFDAVTFTDYALAYPRLDKAGEFQLRNEAGISTTLRKNWSLNLTNIIEYDSDPPINVKKDDLTWLLGLQYSF
jgi:putative salt-induced outer membrane protein YdiY